MEQYNLNSWHAFASMFVFWWQLSSALLLYMYFYLAVNYVVTVFETHFKKNRQDKNIEYQNKKISLYIYLPSEDQLISHKHVLYNIKACWIYKIFVPQERLFYLFFWALIYIRTNSGSRCVHIHFKKKIIFIFHLYYIFDVCTHLKTHLNIHLNIHKEVLPVFELRAYNSLHTQYI